MKSPLLSLGLALWLAPLTASAATVLFSHQGSTDPTTEGWTRNYTTTTVVGSAYDDDGTPVWKVYDPGNSTGGTGLYYSATMNSTVLDTAMTSGWELSATISIPTDDPNSNIAWPTNGNTWLGIIVNESPGVRRYWGLIFGRAANGDTTVAINGYVGGASKTLAPGYYDYSMVYDPVTQLVSVYVDGELWKSDFTGLTTGTGSNSVYWGDNSAQSSAITPRSAYYESVQFTIAPEPSRLMFIGLGLLVLGGRRRRK
jgi:hypothetical protein